MNSLHLPFFKEIMITTIHFCFERHPRRWFSYFTTQQTIDAKPWRSLQSGRWTIDNSSNLIRSWPIRANLPPSKQYTNILFIQIFISIIEHSRNIIYLQIFPENKHLKVTMFVNSLIGVWPFIFENNPKLKKSYNYYSKLIFTSNFLAVIRAYVKLFIYLTEDVLNTNEIFENLATTLLVTVSVVRVLAMKSAGINKIVRNIIEVEENIYASNDKNIITIYNSFAAQSKISNIIFSGSMLIGKMFPNKLLIVFLDLLLNRHLYLLLLCSLSICHQTCFPLGFLFIPSVSNTLHHPINLFKIDDNPC